MCRKLATSLGAAALLVSLSAGTLSAQFNPSGWIQTDGWNYLAPLTQSGSCSGGGATNMERNWIAPHVLGLENPKAGTSYFNNKAGSPNQRIDFGGAAAATGWGGKSLAADAAWVSNDFLEKTAFPMAMLAMPNGDVVDYEAIVAYLNTNVIAKITPTPPPAMPLDDVLGIATTYVENTTGATLEVEICTASDDSVQVWVNNILTSNVSACRGTGGGCDDSRLAYLPPGISKISTLVWEGGGGWGFRLGIRIGGVLLTDTAGAGIEFLGTGAGVATTVGQTQYSALRTIDQDPAFCQMTESITVNLKGSGPGAGGDLLTVIESVTGSDLGNAVDQNIEISAVSNGGVVSDVVSTIPDSTEPNITALTQHAYIGNTCAAGSNTTVNGNVYTSVSLSGGDIWEGGDSFEFQYVDVTGDFDIAIELTNYNHGSGAGRWGKFGLMARQDHTIHSRFTMSQAHGPANDDVARQAGRTLHAAASGNVYEDGYAGMPPRPRFLRLTRRGNVVRGWASMSPGLGDGRLNPCNDGNWVGGRQDDWGAGAPATLSVGFANSEHNSDGCPAQTITFRVIPCVVAPPALLSKTITWTGVPRSAVTDPGLSYDVTTETSTTTAHSGRIVNESTTNGLAGQQTAHNAFLLEVTNSGAVGIFDDSQDIGTPPVLGQTTHSGGTYTVAGSGADIWNNGDDFHFAYQRVSGDFVATAHVAARSTNPDGDRHGRHGIMARHTCARNSKYSAIFTMFPTTAGAAQQDAARHQFRVNHLENGGTRDHYQVNAGTFPTEGQLPTWMRLVRNGNTIYSYLAEDAGGSPGDWCLIGSDTMLSRPDELLVGLAVHSHSAGNLATATFDNVTIEPLTPAGDPTCTLGAEAVFLDFTGADGSAPANARVVTRSGTFSPRIVGNRLRLTEQNIGGSATAAWSAGELPVQNGFAVEFDAYMTHSGLPGDANPADGMTFAVVQGTAAELFPPCPAPTGIPMISALPSSTLVGGEECGASSSTDNGDGSFVNVSRTGKDVWAGGDDFMYTYTMVTGDFDIAIEMTSYTHTTNLGRWGKFGLMARQTSGDGSPAAVAGERTSRYSFVQAHGPVNDDIVSFARRRDHNVPNFDQMDELRNGFDGLPPRPRFLRLTRRGNIVQGWASVDEGLANGSLNPQQDCNWRAGFADDWGGAAPASMLVGFANSEHDSDACQTQTINFRLLSSNASTVQRTNLGGDGGGALGYEGGTLRALIECNPSFAVELDNWVGGGEPGTDPGDGGSPNNDGRYHFGLDQNASVASQQTNVTFGVPTASLPGIFAPMGVHVEVSYATNGRVDVWATANDGTVGRTHVLSDLIQPLDGPGIIGFTAGTGGATATQEVDNLSISTVCCEGSADTVAISGAVTGDVGTPVVLTATPGGLDGPATFAWSVVSGPGTVTDNGDGTADVNGTGVGTVLVSVTVNDGVCGGATAEHGVVFTSGGIQKPNDMNSDGLLDISDPVALLNYLFLGGTAPVCGDMTQLHPANLALLDANGDGLMDISDPTYVLGFLFLGGPKPENCTDDTCPCISITDCPTNPSCITP